MELTKSELLKILDQYNDDAKIYIKTWSSETKKEVEVIEKDDYVVLVGE